MAINTLITIKDALDTFVAGHGQLKSIYWEADDYRAPKITEGDEFPILFVAPIDVQVGRAMNVHTLRVYVYERINDDRLDVIENANDTSLILRDIRVWWGLNGADDIEIVDDPTGTFVSDRELDNLVGYYSDIRFEIPSHGRCDVPVSVNPVPPIPPIECAEATIIIEDSLGNELYNESVPSGGTFTQPISASTAILKDTANNVLSTTPILAEGSEDIIAPDSSYLVEYANGTDIQSGSILSGGSAVIVVPNPIACSDAVVNVNSVFFDNVASGGTLNIQVRKSSGSDLIGSKQGQHWRVGDSNVRNSNTTYSVNVKATENLVLPDITVTDSDGSSFSQPSVTNVVCTLSPNTDIEVNGVAEGSVTAGATVNVTLEDSLGTVAPVSVTQVGNTFEVVVPDAPIPPAPSGWVRPSDWLAMPSVLSTDDTFVGLHAVFPSGNNFAAFRFTTSTGSYQVDWGDGVVDIVASNVVAEHTYDYATYDVPNATLSTRGYKQVIIVVTPLTGNLLTASFQFKRTTTPAQNQVYSTGFLDCILSMPNASTGQSIIFGGGIVAHRYCEQFEIKNSGGCTNMTQMFQSCISLQSVQLIDTSSVTIMQQMFNNCSLLQSVTLFNTSSVTNMLQMFNNCYSLQSVPLFNTSSVTSMQQMFSVCYSLQSVPLFNTSNVTNMSSMFSTCASLQSVQLIDTSSVTSMQQMFLNCASLQSVPLFNTSSVTSMDSMFNGCSSLNKIPALNTTAVTSQASQFSSCVSLDKTDIICKVSVAFINCQLSEAELVNIFNNLLDRTSLASANINITGNWGASALTVGERAIATGKNWTITG